MTQFILVVEDDQRIARLIERGLSYEGYRVALAHDGRAGLNRLQSDPPDLVILDWLLPELDGLEVCKQLRSTSRVPVLMLTAKDQVPDRIAGLDAGADDYLVKPFEFNELLARIRALSRRSSPTSPPEVLQFSDLKLDTGVHRAFRGERVIDLTAIEYSMLELFMRNPCQVLTRDVLFDKVWHYDFGGESNVIEV
jgi:two-component system, OmpR family, response regulator MprA